MHCYNTDILLAILISTNLTLSPVLRINHTQAALTLTFRCDSSTEGVKFGPLSGLETPFNLHMNT